MQELILIFGQLCFMLVYMAVGCILYHARVITDTGSRELAYLLVKLVIPAVLINSFCVEFTVTKLQEFAVATLWAVVLLVLALAVSRLLFPHSPIEQFAAAFSNAGFMGLPLIQATLGPEAVIFVVGFIALLNVLQWTYGVRLICNEKGPLNFKTLVCNPIVAGLIIGIMLFVSGLGESLPELLRTPLAGICSLNTPLAMMVLGVYLAKENFGTLFKTPGLYKVSLVRLAVIPLLSLLVLSLIPVPVVLKQALLLAASAPVGANVAVYAQLHGKDHTYASKMVVLSTLLSPFSMPLLLAFASLLWTH